MIYEFIHVDGDKSQLQEFVHVDKPEIYHIKEK